MQVKTYTSNELQNQIEALTRLHYQAHEVFKNTPFSPELDNIRVRNLKSSKTRRINGAFASATVKIRVFADIVVTDEELNRI